ncbi:MAG: hypothetical protein ACI4OP_08135 [Candidatus Coprovivens sp.]
MGYIKVDKSNTIPTDLRKAATDFRAMTSDLDTWINNNYNVPKSKLYKEEKYQEKSWVEDLKEYVTKTFTRVVYDHRNAYEMYKQWLDKARSYNSSAKAIELKEAERLATAVEGMILLIEQFDDIKNFDLAEGYSGNMDITTSDNGSTVTLYFKDADGNLVRISDLVNCFYSYSGMSMSGVVQGYLYAEANGLEFTAEYQQQILDGVNSTVGKINEAEGFGVVTDADLEGVSTALGFDYAAFVSNAQNTGGNWSNNMEVGSTILNQNYIMQEAFNFDPNNPGGVLEQSEQRVGLLNDITGMGENQISDDPTGPTLSVLEETGPGGPEETLPPGTEEESTVPTKPLDIELIDVGGADYFKNLLPDTEYDYDDLARQMFEGMSEDELLAFREQSINRATGFIEANDVESISNDLTGYGYSQSDIGNFVDVNNKIVKDPDAVIAAYVAGDQNNYMANMANNMAMNDGVTGFTSSHGSNASYSNHQNGTVNANIANMHDDEEVDEASKKYQQAKKNYKQKADEANEAAEDAKEAQTEVNTKVEEYGKDTSKWTEEQAKDYNEAKENYEQAKENYDEKVEEFNKAEQEYKDAKNDYDTAKENFENEIKENVKANDEFYENQTEEVNVSDDQLVEEVGGTGESNSNGNTGEPSGETTTDTSVGGSEQNADAVDTQTHEGTVNGDGTVSASDQGLVDSILGGNGRDAGSTDAGIAMNNEGDVSTAASETGLAGDGLATGGDTGSVTGETSTEPNNGIDDLRNGVDTPDVETSGMDSQTVLETAPASENGIITEGNTTEMADVSAMSEPQGMEAVTTEVTQEAPSSENPLNSVTESSNNDAAIVQQMTQEEAARNEKQKTESAESSDVGTQSTQTVQTATAQTQFRTDAGVKVESSSNENVVSVGNDALLNSIITE